MQVCNEGHSAVVVFENNSCPLCAMLKAFGKPQDAAELGTTGNRAMDAIALLKDVSAWYQANYSIVADHALFERVNAVIENKLEVMGGR